jgi:peptidoglycan hydrolase-like protein with peptidoglycan-binding domain
VWRLDWGGGKPCPGTITPDARGSVVRAWQDQMIAEKWMSDTSANRDGWYGPGMQRVARDMQRALHVPVDGILGPVTWAAIT